jgi:iron complex outermembrane receptor protein
MYGCVRERSKFAGFVLGSLCLLGAASAAAPADINPPHVPGADNDSHDRNERERHERHERHEQDELGEHHVLEEIIVTAQKRTENLQSIPLAVTALTGDALKAADVTTAEGLTDVVPGLEVGSYGANTIFTIRGVTTNTDATFGDSPAAFHIDGIYQGRPAAASGLFYDVERIEVLSGPQGTLYGKNSTGGTINVITNKPTFDGLHGEGEQEFGSYYWTRSFGMINVPLNDIVAFRVAVQTEKHTGYLKTGYDDTDDIAGRLHVLIAPSDNFTALLTGDYFHQGGVGRGQIPIPQAGDSWRNDPWSVPYSEISNEGSTAQGSTNNVSWTTSLQLDWTLPAARVTSISAYHHLHLDSFSFLNGTPARQQDADKEISQEIRLVSASDSATKWVIGAYYHREEQPNTAVFYNQAGPGVNSLQIFPTLTSPSYSLFGQVTYPLTSTLRVTAGLRGNYDKKTSYGGVYQLDTTQPTPVPVFQIGTNAEVTSRKGTWRIGMDKDLTDKSMIFFNVSTGYKQGGVFAGIPPNNTYRPESILAYEIGSKNRFFNDRLQIDIDAYMYKYKDYQVDQLEYLPVPNGPPAFGDFITNAAKATHKGVELTSEYLLTNHDTISLNAAYLSAVFENFLYPLPPDFSAPPSTTYTYADLSGYTEFSAPKWTGTLTYQHVWPLPNDNQLSIRLQSHQESFYWLTPDHKVDSRQPGYGRSQAALQYSADKGKYSGELYVHNIENRAVYNNYTFQGLPPAHNYATIGAPRTYGVRFAVKF